MSQRRNSEGDIDRDRRNNRGVSFYYTGVCCRPGSGVHSETELRQAARRLLHCFPDAWDRAKRAEGITGRIDSWDCDIDTLVDLMGASVVFHSRGASDTQIAWMAESAARRHEAETRDEERARGAEEGGTY